MNLLLNQLTACFGVFWMPIFPSCVSVEKYLFEITLEECLLSLCLVPVVW